MGDFHGDCEIIAHTVKDRLPDSSPLTLISLAFTMCPALCLLEVNYRLKELSFVVLESAARGPTLSTCHSGRFLSLTLNTLSKWPKTAHPNERCFHWKVLESAGRISKRELRTADTFLFFTDIFFDSTIPTIKTTVWKLRWTPRTKGERERVRGEGGKKRKIGRNFHRYNKGLVGKYKPLVITGTWNL